MALAAPWKVHGCQGATPEGLKIPVVPTRRDRESSTVRFNAKAAIKGIFRGSEAVDKDKTLTPGLLQAIGKSIFMSSDEGHLRGDQPQLIRRQVPSKAA